MYLKQNYLELLLIDLVNLQLSDGSYYYLHAHTHTRIYIYIYRTLG